MARRKPLPQALPVVVEALDDEFFGTAEVAQGEVVRSVRLRNALPGEAVEARILKRRRGYWYGNAQPVQKHSPQRRDAACEVFPRCGGCALQHLDTPAQLSRKAAQLAAALEAHAVEVGRWRLPVEGPRYGYRRKARLGVRWVGEQVFVGFREAFASRVVDMTACPALDPRLSALIAPLRLLVAALSVGAEVPQIEVAAGDDDVALVLRHLAPLAPSDLTKLRDFAARHRVQVLTQGGGYDTVQPLPGCEERLLAYGLPGFGLNMVFAPVEFTQVNVAINAALVRDATAALRGHARVADLFCGIGNFSLALARRGADVVGLEASEASVARAAENAARNALTSRCSFAAADLYSGALERLPLPAPVTGMLLDPPRSGAGANLGAWIGGEVSTVAYVSCNPITFAADARVLQDAGFTLDQVGVYDMFPQTTHVETLGVFRR